MKKYKNLTITDTNGADCLIVDPRRFGDARGFFESVTIDELNHLGFNKFSQFSDSQNNLFDNMLNSHKNAPSQTINGIIVYTESVTTGEDVGAPVYVSFIKNNDLKKLVIVGSRDANETAKMASSLKFN